MFHQSGFASAIIWHRLARATLFVAMALLSTSAWAQPVVIQLRNGDRVSGALVTEGAEEITVRHSVLGVLKIPRSQVSKVDKPSVEPLPSAGPATNAAPLAPIQPKPPPSWSGEAQAGIDLAFATKDRQLFSGRFKLVYARQRLRSTTDYLFTYGRTDGRLSANQMTALNKTDFDLTRRFYLYNLAGVGYDQIRELDLHWEEGPGTGYRVILSPRLNVRAEYGLNYQSDRYSPTQPTARNRESGFHRFAEDLQWKITPKLSFDEKLEYFPTLTEWAEYRLRLEANLRYAFSTRLSLLITVLDLYHSDPVPNVKHNDLQIRASIGLKF